MTGIIERAYRIAETAHRGLVDKHGAPYINHLLRVYALTRERGDLSEHTGAAAFLHDVLEDTTVTVTDLLAHGIPAEIVETVVVLTHLKCETYTTYVERIKTHAPAIPVKEADLIDHIRPGGGCPASLRPRYEKALGKLWGRRK